MNSGTSALKAFGDSRHSGPRGALRHSDTWTLKGLGNFSTQALGHSGTQRHLETQPLIHSDIWAIKALEALYLADLKKLWRICEKKKNIKFVTTEKRRNYLLSELNYHTIKVNNS